MRRLLFILLLPVYIPLVLLLIYTYEWWESLWE